jgi:transposase
MGELRLDFSFYRIIMPISRCVTATHQHNNKRVGCNVSKAFTDIDGKALEALITRVSEAKENNLALSSEDCQLLLDALVTLASMQDRLANHNVTVHKLRKLLGIERSSEKRDDVTKQPKGAPKSEIRNQEMTTKASPQ